MNYKAIYKWFRYTFTSATKCEMTGCSRRSQNFQWVKVTGNYWQFCISCHRDAGGYKWRHKTQ